MWVSLGLLRVSFRVSLGFHLRFLQGFFRVSFRGSLVFSSRVSFSSGFRVFSLGSIQGFIQSFLGCRLGFLEDFIQCFIQSFVWLSFMVCLGQFMVSLGFIQCFMQGVLSRKFCRVSLDFNLGPLRFHVGHKQERIKQNNQGFMQGFFRVSRFFKIYISLDFHFGFLQGVGRVSCRV